MAGLDRRDFMKRTGGAVASAAIPDIGIVGRAVSGVMDAAKGFTPSSVFLSTFINKMNDIPFERFCMPGCREPSYYLDAISLISWVKTFDIEHKR